MPVALSQIAIQGLRGSAHGLSETMAKQAMCDSEKTKSQLVEELAALRRLIAEYEIRDVEHLQTVAELTEAKSFYHDLYDKAPRKSSLHL